jgi:Zn-dependent M28 family amino/carboxypeptidase
MLLNLLNYYTLHPPKYTTVFLFFAGEEAGLVGSEYFVKNSPIELKRIKFLLNLDLMGSGDEGIMVVNGAIFESQFKKLTALNDEKQLLPIIKKRGKAANSDHYWFSEKGVPCFFIYTMGGSKAYHDVFDKPEVITLSKYKEVFQLLVQFTLTL